MAMRMRRLLRGGLLVLTACSGHSSDNGVSLTPRITAPNSVSPELQARALTTADLRMVSDLPADAEVVSTSDLAAYEDPDPRGPCGAKIPQPASFESATAGIRSASGFGFEQILRLNVDAGRSYLDKLIGDAQEGCPSHTSRTNTGATQLFQLTSVVDVSGLADQALAVRADITTNGQTVPATFVALRQADLVALVVVAARDSLLEPSVKALARAAASRLRSG
jgi:hypothetical protein